MNPLRQKEVALVLSRWPGVRLGLLFGSRARGDARPDSDADVAVRIRPRVGALTLGALATELGRAAGATVDLTDLDLASPVLAQQIASESVLLWAATPEEEGDWRAETQIRYLDTAHLRAIQASCRRAAR